MQGWWTGAYKGPIILGPVKLEIVYCYKFTKADDYIKSKTELVLNTKLGDIDNNSKAVLDAMQGRVFLDDKQVCILHAYKIRTCLNGISIRVFSALQKF